MKSYAVFYADSDAMREAHDYRNHGMRDGEGKVMAMPKSRFTKSYRLVGMFSVSGLEHLFRLLNDADGVENPLGADVIQRYVISHMEGGPGHTSMSVGDIAVDLEANKMFICASLGWAELEVV